MAKSQVPTVVDDMKEVEELELLEPEKKLLGIEDSPDCSATITTPDESDSKTTTPHEDGYTLEENKEELGNDNDSPKRKYRDQGKT